MAHRSPGDQDGGGQRRDAGKSRGSALLSTSDSLRDGHTTHLQALLKWPANGNDMVRERGGDTLLDRGQMIEQSSFSSTGFGLHQLWAGIQHIQYHFRAQNTRDHCGEDQKVRHVVGDDHVVRMTQVLPSHHPTSKEHEPHPTQDGEGKRTAKPTTQWHTMRRDAFTYLVRRLTAVAQTNDVHLVASVSPLRQPCAVSRYQMDNNRMRLRTLEPDS